MAKYDFRDWAAQRNNAIGFRDHLREIIESILPEHLLTDEDREILEWADIALLDSFDELDKHFVAPLAAGKPSMASHGYEMLGVLMNACFYAGGRGTLGKSADLFAVQREMKVRRPERMQKAKRATAKRKDGSLRLGDDERDAVLKRAILDCVGGDPAKLSSYVWRLKPAHPDVFARIRDLTDPSSIRAGWPSVPTVRRAIQGIQKDHKLTKV